MPATATRTRHTRQVRSVTGCDHSRVGRTRRATRSATSPCFGASSSSGSSWRASPMLPSVFWATMAVAGLATEYLFQVVGIAPATGTARHGIVGRDVWGWNYTSVLDVIALVAFAVILWLYRNRERFGGGAGYAKDPV